MPVLQHVMKTASSGDEGGISTEDATHMARFQDEIVRRAVVAVEGQSVELSAEDVGELSQEDYDRIVEVATRQAPVPKGQA
jgi:hypothetical protein